jgi:predicted AlkP superfamily phosphohydrolase/phosphomutase
LLMVSGDGVRPNNCGWHLMPDVLTQLGYTAAPQQGPGDGKPKVLSLAGIKNLMPNKLRRLIADSLPWWLRDKIGASMSSAQIDWSKTRAFPLPTDLEGCIRINLKGREPHGIVEPGEEYDSLCQKIASEMQELVNPDTGESAVRDVWIVREHFDGPFTDHLPDITVTWNNGVPINALTSESMGTVSGESPDPRTGTHSTQGFAIACGDGFPAGGVATGHLVDLAPTALALLGRQWSGMDGQPLCNN